MNKQEKSKVEKMMEKTERMKDKAVKFASKLKAPVKGTASATAILCMVLLSGCQDTIPSARSNQAGYGDFEPSIVLNGSSNSVTLNITIGDGVYADASGGGDSQATTPTQTTDVKPDIKAAVGAGATASGAAGNNPDFMSNAVNAVYGWLGLNKGVTLTDAEKASATAAAKAACTDGSCAPAATP
jgi:hypothetical protein